MSAVADSDTELVALSQNGNREAFGQIVSRYQSLICSLGYSATGSLSQSEDLAQDTFLTAWRQLGQLREPGKLRSWLCGIARNLIRTAQRRQGREPAHAAEPLETAPEPPAIEPLPVEQAINKEEEAILWRALEDIPETYREPLILFYREHQSVECVARALELSEDAVKQRLARGRKMLQEQVAAFVEGALGRSVPGKAFTLGVLAALPAFTASASAATLGATAAKAGLMAKSAGLLGLFQAFAGLAGMILGPYLGYKMDWKDARSQQRREFVTKCYRILAACMVVFGMSVLSLTLLGWPLLLQSHPLTYVALLTGLGTAYLLVAAALTLWMRKSFHVIGEQERSEGLPASILTPVFEYRSKASLLGLPLIHIRLRGGLERGLVKAWFAAGDAAIGVVFAAGGLAIAPISFGGFSAGLLTLGGFALGAVVFGGFSLGLGAIGGLAVGWQAFGGCAVGWLAAQGGVAIAHDIAVGGVAFAGHANDGVALLFMRDSTFFQNTMTAMRYVPWLNLIWLLPLVLWWHHKKHERKQSRPVR